MTLAISFGSLESDCLWHQVLAQIRRSILAKTKYIFSAGDQFVSTSLCLVIILKVYAMLSSSLTPPLIPTHTYYWDKVYEVRHMIFEWNGHMQIIFIPYWISCLNESLSIWMNKFTWPGFFFYPHKPHPKGNEYHTIWCGEIGIIYGWEIVEGRDHLIPMGRPEFETSTNTWSVWLMLWLTTEVYFDLK